MVFSTLLHTSIDTDMEVPGFFPGFPTSLAKWLLGSLAEPTTATV
jgi:hypothetical protein